MATRMKVRRAWGRDEPFEIKYVVENDHGHQETHFEPWSKAPSLPVEAMDPVRKASVYRTQRHFPSHFWMASTGRLVECESWAERRCAMIIDFAGEADLVVGQPFELRWSNPNIRGGVERHTPDFLVVHEDQSVKVVNVRTKAPKAGHVRKFSACAEACAQHGWTPELWTGCPDVLSKNLEWLSAFRRQLHPRLAGLVPDILERCLTPTPIWRLEANASSPVERVLIRPVIFHCLWHRVLEPLFPLDQRLLCEQSAIHLSSTITPIHPIGATNA